MYTPNMNVPELEIDKEMAENGIKINRDGKLERRIVYNLLSYLETEGFKVVEVVAYDDNLEVNTIIEAMNEIFSYDDTRIYIKKDNHEHYIYFVLGNGEDVISDYSVYGDDRDGFNKLMEAFNVEDYF